MQDLIGSVRRSLAFKPSGEETSGFGGFVEKIGSSIRKSRIGLFNKPPVHALPPIPKAEMPPPRKYMKEEYPMPMMEDEALPPMEEAMEEEALLKIKKEEMVPLARVAKENDKEKEAVGTSGAVKRKESSIRWRKGEMIGCGAFGRVYMGMNLDSGELLAVKEVAIGANSASKKAQDQLLELEKEVNLLKNLSHPNIVRYLGTAREEDSLHILLEFVPGGSISSLLGKFGSFPESVIRMYTKQLLLGLEYLHKYKIMHRDIKGANILVDNKGCIKLADFGASKKVEALATVTGAKSMKGTPYWMAPEVIVQSGHSYSADIWSVGCTVIEMATGKAPWSQQYQEVAALFYIGTTKSHPPIPEHLSAEAQDFLLKCLQKEPDLRPTASDLSKHPFVTGERQESRLLCRPSPVGSSGKRMALLGVDLEKSMNVETKMTYNSLKDVNVADGVRCSTVYPNQLSESQSFWQPVNSDDDMCLIDDSDDLVFGTPAKSTSTLLSRDYNQSFNPMCEPSDHWPCKFDESPELKRSGNELLSSQIIETGNRSHVSGDVDCGFTFPRGPASEDEDEATESRIREFLDEKALELKKLQTPLYEEFYNSLIVAGPLSPVGKENISNNSNLPPKSRSPSRMVSRRFSTALDVENRPSPSSCSRRVSNIGDTNYRASPDKELESQHDPLTPRASFFEREKKWKEELVEELERKRELMRQAGAAKTSSPNDRIVNRHKDRLWFASP